MGLMIQGKYYHTSIYTDFCKVFGFSEADKLIAAALYHSNGVNNQNLGTDPFKWVLLINVGYQCVEVNRYRKWHAIKIKWKKFKQWLIDHGKEIGEHDGDMDFLAMMAGAYNFFLDSGEAHEDCECGSEVPEA
jgi:hypothetical protein